MLGRVGRVVAGKSCCLANFSTAPAPAAAEAIEALQHVSEEERRRAREGRLDRDKDLGARLRFAIVGPDDLDTVNKLLYATYHPYEPLTKHLDLCKGLNSLKDVDRMVEEKLAKYLTLVAYDENGRAVGAAVNNCVLREDWEVGLDDELARVGESGYRPIQAIHHQLRQENKHLFDEIITDKLFDIGMIGVEVENRGQGIATNLIRRSILLAGCLGFRGIKTEATGRFSRAAFTTVGMQPAGAIDYANFEFEGTKPFEGMPRPDTQITFMKKKFFQSALKHIL